MRRGLLVLALFLAAPSTASAAPGVTLGIDPAVPLYGRTATMSGQVTNNGSPVAGAHVDLIYSGTGSTWNVIGGVGTAADGSFAFAVPSPTPGFYAAASGSATSPAVQLTIRPRLTAHVRGLPFPGLPVALRGRVTPATAGTLALHVGTRSWNVSVLADGTFSIRLPSRHGGRYRARLELAPASGFAPTQVVRRYRIRTPSLSIGSSGRAVLALERRLRKMHYALRHVNRFYGVDTYEGVLAFQKVHRMSRTGRVSSKLWNRLGRARVPKARHPRGDHIEVDKTRQVLFEVRRGQVIRVIHASTGATGNTPVGRWHVYWKLPGLNSHGMYYSLFWLRGFAIHGYASVPPWPASHGCVRIPMWQAPGLFSRWSVGATVYVYYS